MHVVCYCVALWKFSSWLSCGNACIFLYPNLPSIDWTKNSNIFWQLSLLRMGLDFDLFQPCPSIILCKPQNMQACMLHKKYTLAISKRKCVWTSVFTRAWAHQNFLRSTIDRRKRLRNVESNYNERTISYGHAGRRGRLFCKIIMSNLVIYLRMNDVCMYGSCAMFLVGCIPTRTKRSK